MDIHNARLYVSLITSWICLVLIPLPTMADWPQYGGNAARSFATSEPLPNRLVQQWTYSSSTPPQPAWHNSKRLDYDRGFQPIIAAGKVIYGSSADDTLYAFDLESVAIRWQFAADGPIRFAPAAWRDRLFVASDDGCLYALALNDGRLLWKRHAATTREYVIGNGRLISRWPARGGPVVFGNTVYFAAGIWPSDGVFVHALECESGKVVWSNTDSGTLLLDQPHGGAKAESGIAPQGYLLADEKHLYLPTGRAVPAVLDRATGKLAYYHLQRNRDVGGSAVILADRFFLNGGAAFERSDGLSAGRIGLPPMAAWGAELIHAPGRELKYHRWIDATRRDRKGKLVPYRALETVRVIDLPRTVTATLAAAGDVVCGFENRVSAVDFKAQANEWWSAEIEGTVVGLAYADGHLVVTTDSGLLICYSGNQRSVAQTRSRADNGAPTANGEQAAQPTGKASSRRFGAAERLVAEFNPQRGYAVVVNCGNGELISELAALTQLHVIGLASGDNDLRAARMHLRSKGLDGTRAAVLSLDRELQLLDQLPPGFANLVVDGMDADQRSADSTAALRRLVQPYRGRMATWTGEGWKLSSPEAPSGAGSWTHQWANAGNTVCSNDEIVRGRLGMNWFRSFDFATPNRHGQGPAPLSHRGFLVVGGVDGIICLDAYNGTELWRHSLPGLLADFDGIHHDIGVGETGGRFCLSDDAVFVPVGEQCLKIDLESGEETTVFRTPVEEGEADRRWGVVFHHNGVLVGSVLNESHRASPRYQLTSLRTESTLLFACDAKTGKLLWKYRPKHSVRNNAIAIAGDTIFFIDRPIAKQDHIANPKRNGRPGPRLKPGEHAGGILIACELSTGREQWRNDEEIWGTSLSAASDANTVLMSYQAMKHTFFRLPSEVGGRMAAFDGSTGKRLWDQAAKYRTRPIIKPDGTVLAEDGGWDLRSGAVRSFPFKRSYGCGQLAAGAHILLYRSATLGYWDLSLPESEQRTESFGGMRPGCYINAIPASGLVLVPEGSTKCRCSYQMKSWFALRPVTE